MTVPATKVQADFDRIALLQGHGWDHNGHYHHFLLEQIPFLCSDALDIGCGTGAFTRLLSGRCARVLGLDLSPNMIQIANEHSAGYPNLDFRVANVMDWRFPADQFDCIVSIATFHHLTLEKILAESKKSLRANGRLVVLDLYRAETPMDYLASVAAFPANLFLRLVKLRRLREPEEVRRAWQEHGRSDSYLTLSQVRQACSTLLPGARVRRHLFWRYSLVWEKK